LKEYEEQTCSNEMGGGGGEELQATATHGNLEEEPKPNLDKVVDNIQVEHVEFVELVVPIVEPTQPVVVATKSSHLVQHIVEPIHVENPQFSISQLVIVFGHFT
jgi:hypothetical protein